MADRPIFPGTIKNAALLVEPGDTTTVQDFVTAGTAGCRIDSIAVTSDDTAAIDLLVYYNDGTTDHAIARVTIPLGAGTNGTEAPVSLLNQTDMPFLGDDLSFYLEGGKKLRIAAQTTVTTAKKIALTAIYGDY